MKSHTVFSALAVSATLALVTMSGQVLAASAYRHVTQADLDALHAGESRDQVIQALGKPQNAPKWLDGSSSLVYELQTGDGDQYAYVDLDNSGKMAAVEIVTHESD